MTALWSGSGSEGLGGQLFRYLLLDSDSVIPPDAYFCKMNLRNTGSARATANFDPATV
jgi:hypothetical protein